MSKIHTRAKASSIRVSLAPSKTGVSALKFNSLAASPKCASSTWPRFILEGTPIGFRTISMGVPSGRKGISSGGSIFATTPLLPCLPAILSPSVSFLVCAIHTRTNLLTPGDRSPLVPLVDTLIPITLPLSPCGTLKEVSLTSLAFSPNIALNNFSSAVNSVSPFGVTLPTSISPGPTSAPNLIIPSSSRSRRLSSPTFGISLVISSAPSFVSLASTSYFSIWSEVNLSFLTTDSFMIIASSKL